MTDYIISNREMQKVFHEGLTLKEYENFFNNKQPIEVIASGVLTEEENILQYQVRKTLDGFATEVLEGDYLNKRVKIFIQLVEAAE